MPRDTTRLLDEKPLAGASFCCTAIVPEERDQLTEWVQEMGAHAELDLTDSCTHLLVGPMSGLQRSEKYDFVAREREDIKVLTPDFVRALRELWMKDQPINMNALEAAHKPPLFHDLIVCFTGFADMTYRQTFTEELAQNGAKVSGDLTRQVTHLICNAPKGDKYEYALTWGLIVVSHAWYRDCMARGMLLDESKYHPAAPAEQQGAGSWLRRRSSDTRSGKRQRPEQPAEKQKRKLRRTASTKFGSQQSEMLNDIVAAQRADPVTERPRVQVARSFAQSMDVPSRTAQQDQGNPQQTIPQPPKPQPRTGILADKHFVTKGYDQRRTGILAHHIVGNGGSMHDSLKDLCREVQPILGQYFLIIPSEAQAEQLKQCQDWIKARQVDVIIATEFWLEHCISNHVFVLPRDYPMGLPVLKIEIHEFSETVVNATGFSSLEANHIEKMVKKLGATYSDVFDVNVNLLIWKSTNINWAKVDVAQEFEMPAVTEQWLYSVIQTGVLPPLSLFLNYGKQLNRPESMVRRPAAVEEDECAGVEHDDTPRSGLDGGQQTSNKPNQTTQAGKLEADYEHDEALSAMSRHEEIQAAAETETRPVSIAPVGRKPGRVPIPLQELDANIKTKSPSTKKKKKLFQKFQSFDGASSLPGQDSNSGTLATGLGNTEDAPISIPDDTQPFYRNPVSVEVEPQTEDETLQQDEGVDLDADFQQSSESLPASGLTGVTTDTSSTTEQARAELRAAQNRSRANLLKDFLDVKEATSRRTILDNKGRPNSKQSNKKLLSRALSNMSSTSRRSTDEADPQREASTKRPLSRVGSRNSDGLGDPLSQLGRKILPTKWQDQVQDDKQDHDRRSNFSADLAALTAFSTSQVPRPPSPSQLPQISYAQSDEVAALRSDLRSRLAQRRAGKAGLKVYNPENDPDLTEAERKWLRKEESEEKRQAMWQELQRRRSLPKETVADDLGSEREQDLDRLLHDRGVVDTTIGRRTRGREKALKKALVGGDEPSSWGGGVLK